MGGGPEDQGNPTRHAAPDRPYCPMFGLKPAFAGLPAKRAPLAVGELPFGYLYYIDYPPDTCQPESQNPEYPGSDLSDIETVDAKNADKDAEHQRYYRILIGWQRRSRRGPGA